MAPKTATKAPSSKASKSATQSSPKSATTAYDKQALAEFRAQIDVIDNQLHDLLRTRVDIIDQVRQLKGKQHIYIRSGREATMLRALMGRPQGKLPEGLIVRVWRELISGFTLMEGGLSVAVYAPAKGPDLWDHARDHFGAFTPLVEASSAKDAISKVISNEVSVAVVPPPHQDDKDAWWPLLSTDKKNDITVFATLPFEILKPGRCNARNALPMGLVVGRHYPELTGDDHSYLSLHCVHVPEAEMKRLLSKAGYKVRLLLSETLGRGASAPTAYWVEADGYIGRADTRLSRLKAMLGSRLQHIAPMGGYASPMKASRRTTG